MDPSAVMNSFTGVVAVIMIFGIPILAIAATMAIVLNAIKYRNRERMRMIEQGMMPPPPKKKKGNWYPLLIVGAILFAFGVGMTVTEIVVDHGDLEAGLIFGCIGLALLICFAYIRVIRKKERPGQPETDRNEPPEGIG